MASARSPLDLPALAVLLLLGVLHHHGPSVDYAGIALAAAASWIGVPGPGEPLLIAGGIYAARGQLDLAEVLAAAFVGATAGGIAGWLLGHRGGRAVWTAPGPLQRLRIAALRRGERFFDRYGVLAVYLTPSWVAGIHGVRPRLFLPANAACAAIWTLLIGLGAYLVGPSIDEVVTDLGVGGAALLALLVLGGLGLGLARRRRRRTTASRARRLPGGGRGRSTAMTNPTQQIPTIPLRGGVAIPQLGFGVFQVPPRDTAEVATRALLAGYRHIDTAAAYGNEAGVGQAIHAAGLERDEVFVTTKCPNDDHGREQAKRALRTSLERLELTHVDLYLIHWPVPSQDRYVETWQALIELQQEGLARAIGVSNFTSAHLERIVAETGVTPAVNQVELHPHFQQVGLRHTHAELGIVTEAWSPLAQGAVLDEPAIVEIARAHGKTPAQVAIRWHLQVGNVAIPKSVTPARIAENVDVFDFHLHEDELAAMAALDAGERTGPDPDVFVRP